MILPANSLGLDSDEAPRRYSDFLARVASTGSLWGIWCGETWATANDPSGSRGSLFLLWSTKRAGIDCLDKNRGKFPSDSYVDSIPMEKWLELYTPKLIRLNSAPFINPDEALRGIIVSPADLRRDIVDYLDSLRLQGSDLTKLKSRVRKRRATGE